MEQLRKYDLSQWVECLKSDDMDGDDREEERFNAFLVDALGNVDTVAFGGLGLKTVKKVTARMNAQGTGENAGSLYFLTLHFYNQRGEYIASYCAGFKYDYPAPSVSIMYSGDGLAMVTMEQESEV